jgi:hypothetical protein
MTYFGRRALGLTVTAPKLATKVLPVKRPARPAPRPIPRPPAPARAASPASTVKPAVVVRTVNVPIKAPTMAATVTTPVTVPVTIKTPAIVQQPKAEGPVASLFNLTKKATTTKPRGLGVKTARIGRGPAKGGGFFSKILQATSGKRTAPPGRVKLPPGLARAPGLHKAALPGAAATTAAVTGSQPTGPVSSFAPVDAGSGGTGSGGGGGGGGGWPDSAPPPPAVDREEALTPEDETAASPEAQKPSLPKWVWLAGGAAVLYFFVLKR